MVGSGPGRVNPRLLVFAASPLGIQLGFKGTCAFQSLLASLVLQQ